MTKRQPIPKSDTVELENEDDLPVTRRLSESLRSASLLLEDKTIIDELANNTNELEQQFDIIVEKATRKLFFNFFSCTLKLMLSEEQVTLLANDLMDDYQFLTYNEKENENLGPCLQSLPVELLLMIFENLPDESKWNLACSATIFMAVFKNWSCFETIPIAYCDSMTIVELSKTIEAPIKSDAFTAMYDNFYNYFYIFDASFTLPFAGNKDKALAKVSGNGRHHQEMLNTKEWTNIFGVTDRTSKDVFIKIEFTLRPDYE